MDPLSDAEESVRNQYMPRVARGYLSNFLCEERPITVDEACGIRLLLFGNTVNSFGDGWTLQGFRFRKEPSYGIVQRNAGPCGLLAAVQAFIIYELLFGYSRTVLDSGILNPERAEKKEALARALSTILWQAGNYKEAVFALKCNKVILDDTVTSNILAGDGILEHVKLKYFRSYEGLLDHLYNYIQYVKEDGGCILFLYSLILTHGIDRIKEEMDLPDCRLIGDDEYCSQEIVNLALTGRAVSNLFDGDVELDSGGTEISLHKGIARQSKIGLLSLYEYENSCNVGSYYKDPEYPIWIIFGESHFTVLFGTSRNIFRNPNDTFNLFYYNCLSKRNEDVCFLIKPDARKVEAEKNKSLSVVVRCILTRWPRAEVEVQVT